MTLIDILLPYQRTFVNAKQRFKIWCSARQIGKSHSLGYLAVRTALTKNKSLVLMISTGSRSAAELLRKCVQFAEATKILCSQIAEATKLLCPQISFQATADQIIFHNGSRILSLPSGNPAALRGYTSDLTIIDEAAFIENPDEVLAAIAPTLTRNPNSQLAMTSTPAGMQGVFYEYFQNAKEDAQWHCQLTTIEDAISDGLRVNLDDLRKLCPDEDTFQREYMCSFSKEYGTFIDTDLLEFYQKSQSFDNFVRYIGIDVGRFHDKTAISIIAAKDNQVAYLEKLVILDKMPYEEQFAEIKALNLKYKFINGYVDAGGIGSALAERIQKEINSKIKPLQFTGANKTPLYEALRERIFTKRIKFAEIDKAALLSDFTNIHRVVAEDGKVKFEAGRQDGHHSDLTSSLVLAIKALNEQLPGIGKPVSFLRNSHFPVWSSRL